MDVSSDRVTFWFGCNVLRHAELIRLCIMLLERAGYDVNSVGGPSYCCGTTFDSQLHAASNMAARTVGRALQLYLSGGRGGVRSWMARSKYLSIIRSTSFMLIRVMLSARFPVSRAMWDFT